VKSFNLGPRTDHGDVARIDVSSQGATSRAQVFKPRFYLCRQLNIDLIILKHSKAIRVHYHRNVPNELTISLYPTRFIYFVVLTFATSRAGEFEISGSITP
jgi:hypothetical protein